MMKYAPSQLGYGATITIVFWPEIPVISFYDYLVGLVGGLEHFLFSIIYGIIIPIDFHIFQDD